METTARDIQRLRESIQPWLAKIYRIEATNAALLAALEELDEHTKRRCVGPRCYGIAHDHARGAIAQARGDE